MPTIVYEEPQWIRRWVRSRSKALADGEDPNSVDISKFVPKSSLNKMSMILEARSILQEYANQGINMTLRQLFYQFVSRDKIENTQKNYSRLGNAVSDGRMWGFLDWDHLVDRGRNFERLSNWDSPASIIKTAANSFRLDLWKNERYRVEVWVEKQALEQVVAQACEPHDVGYMACKGYMSQSEMWTASQRLIDYEDQGQECLVIHLGDHDPSGIDMSRDIQNRLEVFECNAEVRRIALNMDQVNYYSPPPNPAKMSDVRAKGYVEEYGPESWELDALDPLTLNQLISTTIEEYKTEAWHHQYERQEEMRIELLDISGNWPTNKE